MLTLLPPGVVKWFPSALIPRLIMGGMFGVLHSASFDMLHSVLFEVLHSVSFDVLAAVSSDDISGQVMVGKSMNTEMVEDETERQRRGLC